MTEEIFIKRSYKPYQEMDYMHDEGRILCMVLAVDFDERLLKLKSFATMGVNEVEFWARCEHCELPEKKLKAIRNTSAWQPDKDNTTKPPMNTIYTRVK